MVAAENSKSWKLEIWIVRQPISLGLIRNPLTFYLTLIRFQCFQKWFELNS